ncbi:hypothetical protein [Hahella ganghwensis]|uniref:hypothetical protein n=1 Tax=Hahella ganghwensis TaxID=286420 RepID=UPI00037F6EC6|nr:hypothetical protein [Hahella ganghwensis]
MSFDYERVFDFVEENRDKLSLSEFMVSVIDACELSESSSEWELFRSLDYQTEISNLNHHLNSVLTKESANYSELGIWFGIYNPVLDSGEVSAGISFSISSHYDPNDEDLSWASNSENVLGIEDLNQLSWKTSIGLHIMIPNWVIRQNMLFAWPMG